MIETINMSSKGQIVIPEKMRTLLAMAEGSRLVLIEKGGEIVIKKEIDIENTIKTDDMKESIGWMILAERSMKDMWDNPKDDKIWNKYINEPEVE